ncbi:MAG: hypothetical protein ACFCUG_00390 [Thiotrichales bacterium]
MDIIKKYCLGSAVGQSAFVIGAWVVVSATANVMFLKSGVEHSAAGG